MFLGCRCRPIFAYRVVKWDSLAKCTADADVSVTFYWVKFKVISVFQALNAAWSCYLPRFTLSLVDHYSCQCLPLTSCRSYVIVTHETVSQNKIMVKYRSNAACLRESNSNLITVFAIVIPYFTCYFKKSNRITEMFYFQRVTAH